MFYSANSSSNPQQYTKSPVMPAIISEQRVRNKPIIKVWPQNKHTNCFLTPSLFLKLWFGITFLIRYFRAKINLFVLGKQIYLNMSVLSRIKTEDLDHYWF